MKRILTNQISDPTVQQPFTGPSLNFVQDAFKETITSLGSELQYDPSKPSVLSGLHITQSNDGTTIFTSGCVAYNGDVYIVDSYTGITAFGTGDTFVLSASTTDPLGPVIFSDGVPRTVFQDTKLKIVQGTTGTGISGNKYSDYNNWDRISGQWNYNQLDPNMFPVHFSGGTITPGYTISVSWKKLGNTIHINGELLITVTSGATGSNKINIDFSSLYTRGSNNYFGSNTVFFPVFDGNLWSFNGTIIAVNPTGSFDFYNATSSSTKFNGTYNLYFNTIFNID